MKYLNIKVWPELTGYLPSCGKFEKKHEPNIYLDFSGCREISSTGLTVFLLRIIMFIISGSKRRSYKTNSSLENPFFGAIRQLSFFHYLNKYIFSHNGLFGPDTNSPVPFLDLEHYSFGNRHVLSFPIYCLEFNKYENDRRRFIYEDFRKILKEKLSPLEKEYDFHIDQLIITLTEMAKNSADHTDDDAFFGLDLVPSPETESAAIHFIFGDLGCGIKKHIENNLPQEIYSKRADHFGLSESYHHALKRGYSSTRGSRKNRGIGMSLILDSSKGMKMNLSVFDAYSRGMLSSIDKISHEELRKNFHMFSKEQNQPFYYYGVLEAQKT